MNSVKHDVISRLQLLGLKCDELPLDCISSQIAALACFPMYMVANVHGWTTDKQFKVPFIDFQGLESFWEALVIGKKEGPLNMITTQDRKVVDSMLSNVRPPDRVIYEYALETLRLYFSEADSTLVEKIRILISKMVVEVAQASGKGIFGTGEKVSPQERDCINHISGVLKLKESSKAAEILSNL